MANFEFNTFVQGLVSDANPLTYPANSSQDEENMILNKDGSRNRRLGLAYEGTGLTDTYSSDKLYNTYVWRNAGNTAETFIVVQTGSLISFYKLSDESINLDFPAFQFNAGSYAVNGLVTSSYKCTFTDGSGVLYLTSLSFNPMTVTYSLGAFTVSSRSLGIRDFYGADDGLGAEDQPDTLSSEHAYNLLNQGWTSELYEKYKTDTTKYPSNAQVWTAGKNSSDDFDSGLLQKQYFGGTLAPRGKTVLDAFDEKRYVEETLVTHHKELYRPSACAFHSGRVFWSGIRSTPVSGFPHRNLSGHVFFSQVTTTLDRAWKCYQEADPTSEVISDIIDTDGGVIIIPEANEIRGLYAMGNYIVVVASNGVWAIGGVQGYFKATAYTVDKLTDLGCVGSNSIVYANGSLMYWSDSGIMLVSSGGSSVTGLDVSDITNKVLNKYYTSIPLLYKRRARGIYDPLNNIVRFLFSTELSDANTYDMELCYNFNLQAWYKNKYSVGTNKLLSPLFVIDAATTSVVEDIYLTDSTLVEDAYIERTVPVQSTPSVKYLVSDGTKVYFCRQMSQEYKDFGNSFYSYIVTGANIFNDTQRQKMIDYITVSLKRTEDGYTVNEEGGLELAKPSSCLMSVRWDFTDTSVANKWTSPYQVYRYTRAIVPSSLSADNGYSLVQTKNKVRGQGKAISIKFESEEGKEMHLMGWAMSLSGKRNV